MKVSKKGLAEIASHEGIVKKPYKDSVGVWTIGIGHTANAGGLNPSKLDKSVGLSTEEVMSLFAKDIEKFEKRVNKAVKVPLKQHQFDALVSFDYNTGRVHNATLTKTLNSGDYESAANQFMNWSKPKEIIPRRKKEKDLFKFGEYGKGIATVFDTDNNGNINWKSGKKINVLEMLSDTPEVVDTIPKPKPPVDPVSEAPRTLIDWIIYVLSLLLKGK